MGEQLGVINRCLGTRWALGGGKGALEGEPEVHWGPRGAPGAPGAAKPLCENDKLKVEKKRLLFRDLFWHFHCGASLWLLFHAGPLQVSSIMFPMGWAVLVWSWFKFEVFLFCFLVGSEWLPGWFL